MQLHAISAQVFLVELLPRATKHGVGTRLTQSHTLDRLWNARCSSNESLSSSIPRNIKDIPFFLVFEAGTWSLATIFPRARLLNLHSSSTHAWHPSRVHYSCATSVPHPHLAGVAQRFFHYKTSTLAAFGDVCLAEFTTHTRSSTRPQPKFRRTGERLDLVRGSCSIKGLYYQSQNISYSL